MANESVFVLDTSPPDVPRSVPLSSSPKTVSEMTWVKNCSMLSMSMVNSDASVEGRVLLGHADAFGAGFHRGPGANYKADPRLTSPAQDFRDFRSRVLVQVSVAVAQQVSGPSGGRQRASVHFLNVILSGALRVNRRCWRAV